MTSSYSSAGKNLSEYSNLPAVTRQRHTLLQYAYSTRGKKAARCWLSMLGPLGSYFQDTVALCFNVAVDQMGPLVREAVVEELRRRGIRESEIATCFDDAVRVLAEKFRTTGRVIAYNTLVEVCEEYSFPVDFTQNDSLVEKFVFLKDRVLVDRLTPRHAQRLMREMQHHAPMYNSIFDTFLISSHRIQS